MKCTDCAYYWCECDENGKPIDHPFCHYQYNDGYAPCEVEETEYIEDNED